MVLLLRNVDEDALFRAKHVEVEEFVKVESWSIRRIEFEG
jgi:hypothetical protein